MKVLYLVLVTTFLLTVGKTSFGQKAMQFSSELENGMDSYSASLDFTQGSLDLMNEEPFIGVYELDQGYDSPEIVSITEKDRKVKEPATSPEDEELTEITFTTDNGSEIKFEFLIWASSGAIIQITHNDENLGLMKFDME